MAAMRVTNVPTTLASFAEARLKLGLWQHEVFDRNINQELKTTIIIVEQKVHEVLKRSHRFYALRMGEIVIAGSPDDLKSGDKLRRIFML